MGAEYCWQLAAAGHELVVVARNEQRLQALATRIRNVVGVAVEVLPADLADQDDLERVCARLRQPAAAEPAGSVATESGPRAVGLLVNNAGFGLGKSFLENSLQAEECALDVMVRAVMATSHAAGRAMVERGHGAILNVSSVAADTGMGTYSAHKAWVRAFTEGLAEEMRGTGVTATAVMPGMVDTEFHQRMGRDFGSAPSLIWASAEDVVSESLAAVSRGQVLVTPTLVYKAVNAASRLAPRRLVRAVTRRVPHM